MKSRRTVITDFGAPSILTPADGGDVIPISRYGVWQWNANKGRHEVVEVGDDLEVLQSTYGPCEVLPLATLR